MKTIWLTALLCLLSGCASTGQENHHYVAGTKNTGNYMTPSTQAQTNAGAMLSPLR